MSQGRPEHSRRATALRAVFWYHYTDMMSVLEEDILRTIAWFSIFEYPMTSFEVWKWMLEPKENYKLEDVVLALSRSKILSQNLVQEDGVFYLRGSVSDTNIKRERFRDAVKKMKRLKRAMRYLKLIPMIRGVAVCNTLSWMHTGAGSDIDLFIIVKEGSVWTTRLLAVTPFKVLKLRPGDGKDHPLCFSFFLSDTSLSLESLQCTQNDHYLAYWVQSLIPIFDRDGAFNELKHSNTWARNIVSLSYENTQHGDRSEVREEPALGVPGFVEKVSRRLQRHRFPQVVTQLANRDSRVVVSDAMLKFHTNDRREFFKEQHRALCNELGL